MEDDKPFECNAPGCGKRFINEDHLTVHCKKHEMSLALSSENNNVKSNGGALFVDQTPTPTRFIRNCEEVGLFQELNPFEEQFRKHYEATRSGHLLVSEISHGASDNDILNTPSILPDDLQADPCDVLRSCRPGGGRQQLQLHQQPVAIDEVVIYEDESDDGGNDGRKRCEDIVAIEMDACENERIESGTEDGGGARGRGGGGGGGRGRGGRGQAGQAAEEEDDEDMGVGGGGGASSVAFVVESDPRSLLASNCDSSEASVLPSEPIAVTSTSSSSSSSSVATTVLPTGASTRLGSDTKTVAVDGTTAAAANGMVQLILKLPDGRTVPLQIPSSAVPAPFTANPVVSTAAVSQQVQQPRQQIFGSAQLQNSANPSNASYAKMKLREALTQGTLGGGVGSRINYAFKLIDEQHVTAYQDMFNLDSTSNDSSDFIEKSNGPKRKRGDEDPEEKRRRFLERNRAAATRCRQKRKTWIRSLENKADELSGMNEHLQNEVAMLRNEVAHLKSMLLAHKDCPVTQQQQKHMGNLGGLPPGSTIIVNSNGAIQMSADEVIASSALTNLSRSPPDAMTAATAAPPQASAPTPVVLRAIMTHEQALGLLRRSAAQAQAQAQVQAQIQTQQDTSEAAADIGQH